MGSSHSDFMLMQEHGTDPVTGDTMSLDDLISVKTNKVWTGIVEISSIFCNWMLISPKLDPGV
jgi:hypothetical protein